MNRTDVLAKLHRVIHKAGSQAAAARALRITPQYLSDVKYGRREPGNKLLAALGLCKVIQYQSAKNAR